MVRSLSAPLTHPSSHPLLPQTAIFNFESLLLVILLIICTCTYARGTAPGLVDRNKSGCVLNQFELRTTCWMVGRGRWGGRSAGTQLQEENGQDTQKIRELVERTRLRRPCRTRTDFSHFHFLHLRSSSCSVLGIFFKFARIGTSPPPQSP